MGVTEATQTEVDAFFAWQDKFRTIRVSFENDILKARKVAISNGLEEDYGTVYDVEEYEPGSGLPEPGDYPSDQFNDLIIAAGIACLDEVTPSMVSRDVLLYVGKNIKQKAD